MEHIKHKNTLYSECHINILAFYVYFVEIFQKCIKICGLLVIHVNSLLYNSIILKDVWILKSRKILRNKLYNVIRKFQRYQVV